jgi:hypothetical protein
MEEIKGQVMVLDEKVDQLERAYSDLESRMRKVEMAVYKAAGAIMVVMVVLKFIPVSVLKI